MTEFDFTTILQQYLFLFSATHNKKLNMHSATSLYIQAVNTTANYLRIEISISTQETLVFLPNNKKLYLSVNTKLSNRITRKYLVPFCDVSIII